MCTPEEMQKGVDPAAIGAPPAIADEEAQIQVLQGYLAYKRYLTHKKMPSPRTLP